MWESTQLWVSRSGWSWLHVLFLSSPYSPKWVCFFNGAQNTYRLLLPPTSNSGKWAKMIEVIIERGYWKREIKIKKKKRNKKRNKKEKNKKKKKGNINKGNAFIDEALNVHKLPSWGSSQHEVWCYFLIIEEKSKKGKTWLVRGQIKSWVDGQKLPITWLIILRVCPLRTRRTYIFKVSQCFYLVIRFNNLCNYSQSSIKYFLCISFWLLCKPVN